MMLSYVNLCVPTALHVVAQFSSCHLHVPIYFCALKTCGYLVICLVRPSETGLAAVYAEDLLYVGSTPLTYQDQFTQCYLIWHSSSTQLLLVHKFLH